MKRINKGWQYTVYDIGNGRIVKKYNCFFGAWLVMICDSICHQTPPVIRFWKWYVEGKQAASRSLAFVAQSHLDQKIFGHPRILSEFEYEQERVEPLSSVFKRVSHEEGKNVIDAFVEFTLFLFTHSLVEKSFNIANNFGRNANGEIILIDLGEICTTREEAQKRIALRTWSTADVLSCLPIKLRAYFTKSLDAAFQHAL